MVVIGYPEEKKALVVVDDSSFEVIFWDIEEIESVESEVYIRLFFLKSETSSVEEIFVKESDFEFRRPEWKQVN